MAHLAARHQSDAIGATSKSCKMWILTSCGGTLATLTRVTDRGYSLSLLPINRNSRHVSHITYQHGNKTYNNNKPAHHHTPNVARNHASNKILTICETHQTIDIHFIYFTSFMEKIYLMSHKTL